jgi:hypothetical protein
MSAPTYPHLHGKRGYSVCYLSKDGKFMQFEPPSISSPFMNVMFACGVAKHCSEELSAKKAWIIRNTFGPKGNISSGHVVIWKPLMRCEQDIEEAPHDSFLFFPSELISDQIQNAS